MRRYLSPFLHLFALLTAAALVARGWVYALALALQLALLAAATFATMEPGRYRSLTWVLLGFFAFRVVLGYVRSR